VINGVAVSGSFDGYSMRFLFVNASGGVVNLAYTVGVYGAAAPTTVANGQAAILELRYESTIGWVAK
jgi:hypothetical protein